MLSTENLTRVAIGIASLGLAVSLVVAGPGVAAPAAAPAAVSSTPAAAPAAAQDPASYVGQETCLGCHADRDYKGTAHALKTNPRSPASTHGCESCHGPGKAHVDGGGDTTKILNPGTMAPQRASEQCESCHNRGNHALWPGSQHDNRNVGCVSCHSTHAPKGPAQIKAADESQLCASCHRNVVNKQRNRFNHMPVREGKLSCSSCHNPHGSPNQKLLSYGTTVDQSCASCHAEKRGPYLWEHAPVANSCVTCHDPHGSNNDRMLVSKQPFLCQRCHVTSRHPPTVYDAFVLKNSQNANKITGRSCTVCHQQIHGSNAPSGKAFIR
ncbi:MAG: DmsE family decaheme c-type cytochrome [Vicinamibacterales bacterium]